MPAGLYEAALDVLDDAGTVNIDEREESWRAEGWVAGGSTSDVGRLEGEASRSSGFSEVSASFDAGEASLNEGETIPVVEERLKVGKRDVSHGRVRVRSYVRETPVSEQVNLAEERVQIERRPVDRPADEDAFRERSIEAEERREEAVVSKEARVVEEIALLHESDARTETVSDTVRSTEVEVEDERDEPAMSRERGRT